MLKTGIIGAAIAAICCFTPALVLVLGGLGLASALVWADYILLPMLAMSLALIGAALWKRRQARLQNQS